MACSNERQGINFEEKNIQVIKHDNVCDKCKRKILKGEICNINLKTSKGGPYLEITHIRCEKGEE